MSDSGAEAPRPRLCRLRKWSYFQGYGFNLHAEKTRNGQFIGKVDANSPAEAAGLKEKDRIIEVNYVNISNENHQQVVKRIRSGLDFDGRNFENEVVLLVVDEETDNHFKKLNQVIKNSMDEVLRLETPPEDGAAPTPTPTENNNQHTSHSPAPERVTEQAAPSPVPSLKKPESVIDSNNNIQANHSATNSQSNTRASSNASTPVSKEKFSSNHSNNSNKASPPNTPLSVKSHQSSTSSNHNSNNFTTSSNSNLNNNVNNHSNDNKADDVFIKINFKNRDNDDDNSRIPPKKPPRLIHTKTAAADNAVIFDDMSPIRHHRVKANFDIEDVEVFEPRRDSFGNNSHHRSNSSIVDEEFHAKGINAVREMLNSTSSRKEKVHPQQQHHFHLSNLNPLKLSKKFNRDDTARASFHKSSPPPPAAENRAYEYLSSKQSFENRSPLNNNNNKTSLVYSEAESIKSTKKFSNEPQPSPNMSSRLSIASNSLSSTSAARSSREEQAQRNYSQSEKKLNDFFKMSASEFKNYLKNKQKTDPRTSQVDMKQKFQLFQNM